MYRLSIALHFLAWGLWLGHMFVWSLIAGPAMKRIEPAATAQILRERSLFLGGLGWPALVILVATGIYMLQRRGIAPHDLLSTATYHGTQGVVLAVKLATVLCMIGYQTFFGHRSSALAIYLNMLFAIVVIGASVTLVRGWV